MTDDIGGGTIPIATAFISSRMEELAIERKAAFNATYESNITPLLFEIEPPDKGLKAPLDSLVDRADLFVGIYYKSTGIAHDELFHMTPIEYELWRFLEVWRIRSKHGKTKSNLSDDIRRYAWDEVRSQADRTLALLGGAEESKRDFQVARSWILNLIWQCSTLDCASEERVSDLIVSWKKRRPKLKHLEPVWKQVEGLHSLPNLLLYRLVVRTRVGLFVRADTDKFWRQAELDLLLPQIGHFSRIDFMSREEEASEDSCESAVRFSDPSVELYQAMKSRLNGTATLSIDHNSASAVRPENLGSKSKFSMHLTFYDRPGVLEDLTGIFFEHSLSILLLELILSDGTTEVIATLASGQEFQSGTELDRTKENILVAVQEYLQRNNLEPNSENVHAVVLFPEPVCSHDDALDRLSNESGFEFDKRQFAASFRVQGANVPGIFLSIARVIAGSDANIERVKFSSFSKDVAHTSSHQFLKFDYFSGDLLISYGNGVNDTNTWEECCLSLRFKLLNLLGVQAIRIMKASDSAATYGRWSSPQQTQLR